MDSSFSSSEFQQIVQWVSLITDVFMLVSGFVILLRFRISTVGGSKDVREELRLGRQEARSSAAELRQEMGNGLHHSMESVRGSLRDVGVGLETTLDRMKSQINEDLALHAEQIEKMRLTLDSRVREMQQGNERKLEEMRRTVDEKLHDSLEKRLGESFRFVSERLESVQKGLGEMQSLATGVGDLRRVLSNVKVRGTWAEV